MRVSASGGAPKQITRPTWSSADWGHRFPAFLPGGHAVLFTIVSARFRDDEDRVAVLSLDTGAIKVVARGGLKPVYVPSGHLLVAQSGQLLAAPFDLERLAVTGPAVPVVENVFMNPRVGPMATYDVSASGTLAYVSGYQWSIEGRLVWFDRRGHVEPGLSDEAGLHRPPPLARWAPHRGPRALRPRRGPVRRRLRARRLDPAHAGRRRRSTKGSPGLPMAAGLPTSRPAAECPRCESSRPTGAARCAR